MTDEKMNFPATFQEFSEDYKIVDKEQIYTNGTALIPIFRVEQWLEHITDLNQSEMRGMIDYCQRQMKTAKSESRKEFAERLKEEMRKYCGDITEDDIDNLLKEMGCERNE